MEALQNLEELKQHHEHLKCVANDRINDKAYCTDKSLNFVVGELVLLKDHQARGLNAKYLGTYQIIHMLHDDSEIESLETGKRQVVHSNSFLHLKQCQSMKTNINC